MQRVLLPKQGRFHCLGRTSTFNALIGLLQFPSGNPFVNSRIPVSCSLKPRLWSLRCLSGGRQGLGAVCRTLAGDVGRGADDGRLIWSDRDRDEVDWLEGGFGSIPASELRGPKVHHAFRISSTRL